MPKPVTVLVLVGLLLFGLRALLPIEIVSINVQSPVSEILLAKQWYLYVLSGTSFAGLFLFLLIACISLRKKRWGTAFGMLVAGCVGFIACWGFYVLSNLAPWMLCSTLQAQDGATYSFLYSSFLQGRTMAITRRSGETPLFVRYQVFGTNNGDSPRSWASMIRPKGASDGYGTLASSESGWILGLSHDEACYLAYHFPTGKFLGHGDVEALSPFLLMTENTIPSPDDVSRVLERMRTDPLGMPGQPHERVLHEGLSHPNPQVREIAAQMLSIRESRLAPATRPND